MAELTWTRWRKRSHTPVLRGRRSRTCCAIRTIRRGRCTPYLSVPGAEDAFAVTSASKAWNLSGLKAALVIAGPESAADLRRMPEEVSHGPSHLGVIAHAEAFRTGGDWLDLLLQGLDENRTLLGDLVAEHLPGVSYLRPQALTWRGWIVGNSASRRPPSRSPTALRWYPISPGRPAGSSTTPASRSVRAMSSELVVPATCA